jgi:Ran GTPase-activating protein (RanGAP) involved in mRNA processing and transport
MNHITNDRFGLLRSCLSEINVENWRNILSLLGGWPTDDFSIAFEYTKSHLHSWPDDLKKYPLIVMNELESPNWFIHKLATTLDLNWNEIGPEGTKALANSPSLQHLKVLKLYDNYIGDEGASALAKSTGFQSLEILELGDNRISDTGAKDIANNTSFHHLKQLDLSLNYIGDKGAIAIANSTKLHRLEVLRLGGNNIGDEGRKAIANCIGLRDVKVRI